MQFRVTGIDRRGAVATLELDAATAAHASQLAIQQGCTPVEVRAAKRVARFARRTRFSLLLFTQELLALLDSGVTLVEGLETLAEKETRSDTRHVIESVLAVLREGATLSASLERHPRHFPPLYIATVRASERTGNLAEALARYAAWQAQADTVRKRIVGASIYPALLLVAGLLVTLFLLGFVVPRFSEIYADSGADLPWLSLALLAAGNAVQQHGAAAAALLVIAIAAAGWTLRRPAVLDRIVRGLWRIPAVGERMRLYALARFYRAAGMLLRGGMPAVSALELAAGLLERNMRGSLSGAIAQIREGISLSAAMDANGLATPVALRMLRVGERSGRMGEMMERIAAFYDEDIARWVDWATRLFEPILMAAIGLVIGGIVVLMYIPVFELAGSLQ